MDRKYSSLKRISCSCFVRRIPSQNLWIVLILSIVISGCQGIGIQNLPSRVIHPDLPGSWKAEYTNVKYFDEEVNAFIDLKGEESLEFNSNGTYHQIFENKVDGTFIEQRGEWYIDEGGMIHLQGGLWPQLGPKNLDRFLNGKFVFHNAGPTGEYLDGTEVLLIAYPRFNGQSPGFSLQHLPTGDPDSPYTVRFRKIEQ